MARRRTGRMPPALRAYWAKKNRGTSRRATSGRRNTDNMARRKSRSGGRRSAGFGGGLNFKPAIAGLGSRVGAQVVGAQYGPAVGTTAAGFLLKDPFSKDLGMYQLGAALGSQINLPGFGMGTATNGGSSL